MWDPNCKLQGKKKETLSRANGDYLQQLQKIYDIQKGFVFFFTQS